MSRIERVEHLLQSIEYETKAAFDEHTELLNENERLNAENAKLMEENAKLRKFCAELYNSLGEKLYITTAECSATFNMENYPAGLYVIKVYKKGSDIYTFKVIKN